MKAGFYPGKMEGNVAFILADFLIGPEQIIHRRSYYGKNIGDHIPIPNIRLLLKD